MNAPPLSPKPIIPTPSTDKLFHSPVISEAKVKSSGRIYTHLTSIQRLGRLVRIISMLLLNSLGINRFSTSASKISEWWDEFKKGKRINVKKSSDAALSDLKKREIGGKDPIIDIGKLKTEDRQENGLKRAVNEDPILAGKSEAEITRAKKMNAIITVINDENVKKWLIHAEKSAILNLTKLYENLKKISETLNNEKSSINEEQIIMQYADNEDQILAIKNTPANSLDKLIQQHENEFAFDQEEDNEAKTHDKMEQPQPVLLEGTKELETPQTNLLEEEPGEQSASSESGTRDHQEDELEKKGVIINEETPPNLVIVEEIKKPKQDNGSIELKIETKKETSSAETQKDSLNTQKASRIHAISNVINDKNVKAWLIIAAKNLFLSQTSIYQSLKEITNVLNNKERSIYEEQIISQYTNDEDKILAIKNTPTDHLAKLIQQQENEFVFNMLKNNALKFNEIAKQLKNLPHGKFKANLQSLLDLISTPSQKSPLSTPLREEHSLEKSVRLNESALAAVLTTSDPAKTFAIFEAQINEEINQSAKDAFIAFAEILKAGAKEHDIDKKLSNYNHAEAAIQKAIIDLAKPLEEIAKDSLGSQLTGTLEILNKIFKSLPNIDKEPSLKNLITQNTHHAARAFLLLEEKKNKMLSTDPVIQKIVVAIYNLKTHLGAEKKERLNFVIDLGRQVIENPEKAFNQYLETEGVLRFTQNPPVSSLTVERFLKEIDDYLDKKTYTTEELLALEAFTSVTLYSYIINPQTKIDSSFQPIAEILITIRSKIERKLNEESMKDEVKNLRTTEENQNFYKFLKEKMENTPTYPKDFWFDPRAIEKMTIEDSLLRIIGGKIASPDTQLNEPAQLVPKNDLIDYEIYFYPSESKNEKPKLLFFLTKSSSSSTLQGMNHQLGLFGDPAILKFAQEVISNITSTEVLEGYQQDLVEGNLDIIVSGFDNSGAAASIVANKLALVYQKTTVTSISAGSTTIVTTEDAYNLNQTENCFAIRLKYVKDGNVDRTLSSYTGDFSENNYHTFPLLVKYNQSAVDINKHNKEEYGNVDNFIPAMTNPLILRGVYQEISDHIIYTDTNSETTTSLVTTSLTESLLGSGFFDSTIFTRKTRLYIGQLDDLIALGDYIRDDIEDYNDAFLKLDQQKLSMSHKSSQLKEFEKNQKPLEDNPQKKSSGWSLWGTTPQTDVPVTQKNILTVEEQENTVYALQQTISYLKNREVMNLITPGKAISLLVAADTLLINYTKINTNVGKLPQLVDLISEIRELVSKRLEILYQDEDTKDVVSRLLKKEGANLEFLANRVLGLNDQYEDLLKKKEVLDKIDYEDRFLEYLGFKIAEKGQDKLGSEPYVSKLETNNNEDYDISLFTPEEPNKKQRIVISCNGPDALGTHKVLSGEFGTGDEAIILRAEKLKKLLSTQLKNKFKQHNFNTNDIDIVVTGFGSEGAVATVLGYFLSKEFEKQGCQVQSVGFGAPRFTTQEGANLIKSRQNFLPLRFLSPTDTRFEWKLSTLNDHPLSHDTYYTIPLQFRIVGAFEIGGHNPNLYGDIQGIKTSMKTAYRMRKVAHENENLSKLKEIQNIDNETATEQPSSSRIVLDTRKASLIDFSQKSVDDLKKVEPGKLIRIMKYCVELSENDKIPEEDKDFIKNFFSTFIQAIKNNDINENHTIHNSFYKMMVAHGYKTNQLFGGKWKIQQMISNDLENAMKAVKHANKDKNLDAKTKSELILQRNYHRGILAGDLNGNRYKPAGGGVNGAVFLRHLESGLKSPAALLQDEVANRPFLGVFKPHPETVREFKGWFDAGQWKERVKAIAGMDSHLNKKDPNYRVNNEIFAYELFHAFGFNSYVGFPTTLKFTNKNDTNKRPASFCDFIPGLDIVALHVKEVSKQEAKSDMLDNKRTYSDQELHIWQMSKIFDFLAGNMDGHEGNAFVKVDQQNKVIGAVNFDYDKAFAIDSPNNIVNQYKWADLKISKQNITNTTKDALEKMFTGNDAEAKIQAFLTKARGDAKNKQNFTEDQETLLRKRIDVLKKIVTGNIQRLSELKNYK